MNFLQFRHMMRHPFSHRLVLLQQCLLTQTFLVFTATKLPDSGILFRLISLETVVGLTPSFLAISGIGILSLRERSMRFLSAAVSCAFFLLGTFVTSLVPGR